MLRKLSLGQCWKYRKILTTATQLRKQSGAATSSQEEDETHFGFQTVSEKEKQTKVDAVFENVAEKYDEMNDAMSIGIHRLWKDHFMQQLAPPPGTKLLDVAGGTGDIAFRFLKYTQLESSSQQVDDGISDFDVSIPSDITKNMYGLEEEEDANYIEKEETPPPKSAQTHVTVCDINQAMLDVGKVRAKKNNIHSGISWLRANAECLPIEDNSYDAYTIAYGIRNVTHIDKVLSEAYRVLKPGGRFMCLEFSQVPNPVLRKLYDEYSFQVIPVMGQIIAADWHSYQYLVESIRQFPPQEEFADMIRQAGFSLVTYENLTFGVTAIHSGFKL